MRLHLPERRKTEAERWFAWHPVWVMESRMWVWLEPVIRRDAMTDHGTHAWVYRLPSKPVAFRPPDDSGGWIHETGPGFPPRWRNMRTGVTVPTAGES